MMNALNWRQDNRGTAPIIIMHSYSDLHCFPVVILGRWSSIAEPEYRPAEPGYLGPYLSSAERNGGAVYGYIMSISAEVACALSQCRCSGYLLVNFYQSINFRHRCSKFMSVINPALYELWSRNCPKYYGIWWFYSVLVDWGHFSGDSTGFYSFRVSPSLILHIRGSHNAPMPLRLNLKNHLRRS